MIFCFSALKLAPKTHTSRARCTPSKYMASCVKLRCIMEFEARNLLICQQTFTFMHMCAWFDAVRWRRTRIEMADREHTSLTRQVHVVFEPHGQSEHKRALPLHLVTRPAPCRHPRLQTGQCSCAVNESQCVIQTSHAPQLSPPLLRTAHGGPIPPKSRCCWLVTKLKLH